MVGSFSALTGMVVGLSVSAPIGPMGLLCINRTLNSGWGAGIATGAGQVTVMTGYGALVFFGVQNLIPTVTSAQSALNAVGGLLMILFGLRILARRGSAGGGRGVATRSLLQTYLSAAAFSLTNPVLVILLTGAITSLIDLGRIDRLMICITIAGMMIGSMSWWVALSGATAALRVRLAGRMLDNVNGIAAFVLISLGGWAIVRSALAV
ncbi:MAG: hypothetical protein BGO51_14360 [Rhodospirillales bacterium 69-11]|nr:MAG: hypothetical protein BGO51_14360 [Rhodospirillales bacterium 69-11]